MEFEKMRKIVADILNVDPATITMETRFIEDLGADSLDLFQIVLAIEDEFEITVEDSQFEKITTIGTAVEEIKKSING